MSGIYEGAIQDLIDALGRLPGIGPKSAQRIAFHILQAEPEIAAALVDSIRTVKERVKFCTTCGNVSEEDECRICRDPRRENTSICVVEESKLYFIDCIVCAVQVIVGYYATMYFCRSRR